MRKCVKLVASDADICDADRYLESYNLAECLSWIQNTVLAKIISLKFVRARIREPLLEAQAASMRIPADSFF